MIRRREFITLLGGLGVSDLNIEIKRSNGGSAVLLLVHPGNPDREQAREGEGGQGRTGSRDRLGLDPRLGLLFSRGGLVGVPGFCSAGIGGTESR